MLLEPAHHQFQDQNIAQVIKADVLKVPNFFPQTPDWQVFHPQSGDFVQLLAKKLNLFVI